MKHVYTDINVWIRIVAKNKVKLTLCSAFSTQYWPQAHMASNLWVICNHQIFMQINFNEKNLVHLLTVAPNKWSNFCCISCTWSRICKYLLLSRGYLNAGERWKLHQLSNIPQSEIKSPGNSPFNLKSSHQKDDLCNDFFGLHCLPCAWKCKSLHFAISNHT